MKGTILLLSTALLLIGAALSWFEKAHSAASDEEQIRQLLDHWKTAFEARDIQGIMSIYAPGDALTAFDLVPPLRYAGADAYRKDYSTYLSQYQGSLKVEIRDLTIVTGDRVAYAYGLERISGTLVNGQKTDGWVRFTQCYRKLDGHWLATHDHISVPADLETGKAALDLQP